MQFDQYYETREELNENIGNLISGLGPVLKNAVMRAWPKIKEFMSVYGPDLVNNALNAVIMRYQNNPQAPTQDQLAAEVEKQLQQMQQQSTPMPPQV